MRFQRTIILLFFFAPVLFSGCVTGGSGQFDTTVTDMHTRVVRLDKELDGSIAELNEKTAALIARVDENERQVRLLYSMMEENQRKIDNLLRMLYELKVVLYKHWGLDPGPPFETKTSRPSGVRIEPPSRPSASSGATSGVSVEPPPAASAPRIGDAEAYTEAKKYYDSDQFGEAQQGFASFISEFPSSEHRHKALFWLGKCYLEQSEYTEAIRNFEALRREYPESSYMAYALHNQAVAHYRRGEKETAIALMEEVIANYPTSTAADQARGDLKQLQRR